MLRFIVRRIALLPLTFAFLALVVFLTLRLTADPVSLFLDINGTPEQAAELRRAMNLDRPLPVQFALFLVDIIKGDFGRSMVFSEPALPLVLQRVVPTLELVAASMLVAVGVGFMLGLYCAARRDGIADFVVSSLAIVGQSMPSFWLGILLIQLFALYLGWLPTSGYGEWDNLVLPALTLAAFQFPNFVLVTRTSILDVLGEQFVTTARSKGIGERLVLFRHVVPNAIAPILTLLGLQLGVLIGGSIITETVFAWPGVGRLIISSIFQRDIPVVMAGVFVMSAAIMLCNLAVDVALSVIDPRIRMN